MVIDPAGRVRATLSPRQSGVLISRTGLVDAPTFYASRGDVLVGAGVVALLVAAAADVRRALAHHWRRPAFQSVLSAAGLPWFAAMLLLGVGAPWWVLPAVLSGFLGAAVLPQPARGLSPQTRGHRPRGRAAPMLSALVGASVAAVGLWSLTMAAFRASGMMLPALQLPGGWLVVGARQLLAAGAIEFWLRGIAFAHLREWQVPGAAVAVTTMLGMSLQAGLPPEGYSWAIVAGAAVGPVRAGTGDRAGPGIPPANGNIPLP